MAALNLLCRSPAARSAALSAGPSAALVALVAFFSLAAGSACGAETRMAIGFTATAEPAILFAAQEDKLFARRGIEAGFQMLSNGSAIVAGLVAGSLQAGSLPTPVVLQAIDSGIDLVLIAGEASTVKTSRVSAVVARTGTGIKSASDLIGKRVAVSGLGSISYILARRWLTVNKVDPKKVVFVEIPFSNHADALRGGNVDAAVTAEPVVSRLSASGAGVPIHYMTSDLPEGIPMISIAATRQWANENRDAIKALRDALAESKVSLLADPAKARPLLEKYLKVNAAVAAGTEMPSFDISLPPPQVQWWIDLMNEQGMLRSKFGADKAIFK